MEKSKKTATLKTHVKSERTVWLVCCSTLWDWFASLNSVNSSKTEDKHQQPAKITMLDGRKRAHGSSPTCESAYTFTLEDQSATRGCTVSPPLSAGANDAVVRFSASVHVKVLVSVCVKMLISIWACASVLRVDAYPLSKAEVRKYREKRKEERKKKNTGAAEKGKHPGWLKTGSKQVFSSPRCLFSEDAKMSFHARAGARCVQVW